MFSILSKTEIIIWASVFFFVCSGFYFFFCLVKDFVVWYTVNPFPNNKFFDSFGPKDCSDDNFDENGGKFSKKTENTVGKGEIAHYEQFLLFPWCFQKTCTSDK